MKLSPVQCLAAPCTWHSCELGPIPVMIIRSPSKEVMGEEERMQNARRAGHRAASCTCDATAGAVLVGLDDFWLVFTLVVIL